MFVIDEMTGIGWWATDRNQIPDKVTIYMFKRNDVRENYDSDNDNIYSLAALRDIKATWADDADYASLKESIESISADTDKPDDEFVFYVMNGVRYTHFDNFQSSEARSLMEKRVALASQLADDKTELKRMRAAYANAKPAARKKMEQSILQLEHKVSDATKTLANIDNNNSTAEQRAIDKKPLTMIDFKNIAATSQLYNFHSHTQFCDGHAEMPEFAAKAAEMGFSHYGFSPHSPVPKESP